MSRKNKIKGLIILTVLGLPVFSFAAQDWNSSRSNKTSKTQVAPNPATENLNIPTLLKEKTNCICTMEYAPVCGQIATEKKTYSNKCALNCAGATFISEGECQFTDREKKRQEILREQKMKANATMGDKEEVYTKGDVVKEDKDGDLIINHIELKNNEDGSKFKAGKILKDAQLKGDSNFNAENGVRVKKRMGMELRQAVEIPREIIEDSKKIRGIEARGELGVKRRAGLGVDQRSSIALEMEARERMGFRSRQGLRVDGKEIENSDIKKRSANKKFIENILTKKGTKISLDKKEIIVIDDNEMAEINEVEVKENEILAKGIQKKKFLGIFDFDMEVKVKLDKSGEIEEVDTPWYSFLLW